jgi:FOG: TPR repeat, SEL1 subfamily
MFTLLYRRCICYIAFGLTGIPVTATAGELMVHNVPGFRLHVMEMPKSVAGMPLSKLEKWARAGDPAAEDALGVHYLYGRGVPENWQKADAWFRKSAQAGNASGAFNLAFAYNFGEGLPRNTHKADYWWQQSSKDRKK